jgi:hypothetical protein
MRSAGALTRCDFIRLNAAARAKRVVEYAVDAPAGVLQLCCRFVVYFSVIGVFVFCFLVQLVQLLVQFVKGTSTF